MSRSWRKDEADDCVEIKYCNREGVLFVVADQTSSGIDDLKDFALSMELKRLLPTVPGDDYASYITSDPLLLLQHLRIFNLHSHFSFLFFSINIQASNKMEIEVKESTMVQPTQDTPNVCLWMNNVDHWVANMYVLCIYFYRPNGSSDFFDTSILKEALCKVLVPFYQMAGRMRKNETDDHLEINCNGDGALFVVAKTNSNIDDLGDFTPTSMELKRLFPPIPGIDYNRDITSDPLLLLQVTRFNCGGVSIGMATHHYMADGTTAMYFIKTWCGMVRGLDHGIPPFVDRTILRARDPPSPTFEHIEYHLPPSMKIPQQTTKSQEDPDTTTVAMLKITREQLNILKAKAKSGEKDEGGNIVNYSSYEVMTGHIWRCSCKARGLPDDQETKLYMAVDGRSKLRPPLPPNYVGNVIFAATPILLSGDLINNPLTYAVRKIHDALIRMDDEYLRSAIDYLELNSVPTVFFTSPNILVLSWAQLKAHDVDFGWGRPIYVGPVGIIEGIVYVLPNPTNDGSMSLAACLKSAHMKVFQKILYEF
ncbi:hypothetical protein NE237_024700 [Protea cynaroides]|uniref:Uncharacterized protein n=1 Tax=Protea cynaroides TaxID=273540 RepID=A0A9Q0JYT2_9MAGN|nr:hypothetical protein NE237_024700 [Protea cynaroides]